MPERTRLVLQLAIEAHDQRYGSRDTIRVDVNRVHDLLMGVWHANGRRATPSARIRGHIKECLLKAVADPFCLDGWVVIRDDSTQRLRVCIVRRDSVKVSLTATA